MVGQSMTASWQQPARGSRAQIRRLIQTMIFHQGRKERDGASSWAVIDALAIMANFV